MKWLIEHWSKSTLFIAIYISIMLVLYVMETNFLLFLIWIQTPVYLMHQFEEYIFPGGFLEFFNRKILGSDESEFPVDKKASFWINIPLIFIAFPLSAILSDKVDISIGIWTAYFSIINALAHVGMSFKYKYNPGLVVSLLLNIPVGIFTISYFIYSNAITTGEHLIGLTIGILAQVSLMIYGFVFLKPTMKKK